MMNKLTLMGALALSALSGTAFAETWNMPTCYNDASFATQTSQFFADRVKAATNGKLDIVLAPNGALVKCSEIKRAVQTGQVPIAEVAVSTLGNESPIYEFDVVTNIASGYPDWIALNEVQRPYLQTLFEKDGLKMLTSVGWPPQGIYAQNEVNSLADIEGQKFRSYSALTARLVTLMGTVQTNVQFGEVAQAFGTGVIDGMVTSAQTGVDVGSWNFAKYYYATDHATSKSVIVINKAAMDALDDETRNAIMEVALIAEAKGWQLSMLADQSAKERLASEGMQVLEPSDTLKAEMAKIGDTMGKEYLERGATDPNVEELFNDWVAVRDWPN